MEFKITESRNDPVGDVIKEVEHAQNDIDDTLTDASRKMQSSAPVSSGKLKESINATGGALEFLKYGVILNRGKHHPGWMDSSIRGARPDTDVGKKTVDALLESIKML